MGFGTVCPGVMAFLSSEMFPFKSYFIFCITYSRALALDSCLNICSFLCSSCLNFASKVRLVFVIFFWVFETSKQFSFQRSSLQTKEKRLDRGFQSNSPPFASVSWLWNNSSGFFASYWILQKVKTPSIAWTWQCSLLSPEGPWGTVAMSAPLYSLSPLYLPSLLCQEPIFCISASQIPCPELIETPLPFLHSHLIVTGNIIEVLE